MPVTPKMNITLPTPSTTPGPTYATQLNTAVEVIDVHDHSPGKGTLIPSAGIGIDADLNMNSKRLTAVQAVNMNSQSAALSAANVQSLYAVSGDLYYNNSAGTPVQITQGTSITSASSPLVPTGVIWPYGGNSAPTGFLMCDGTAVSRTTYADLFAAIGTAFGVGDGATTFNIPNANGRAAVGAGTYTDSVSGSVTRTLGTILGAEKHVLITAELAAHSHGAGSHTHFIAGDVAIAGVTNITNTTAPARSRSAGDSLDYQMVSDGTAPTVGKTSAASGNTDSSGSDVAHNNMQPSFVTNFIIKT